MKISNEYSWWQKYRPDSFDDLYFEKHIQDDVDTILEDKDFPHLIFHGSAGIGKTTLATILCESLKFEYIKINGSLDNKLDTIRETISRFAETTSLLSDKKVILLDEVDNSNNPKFLPALRPVFEEFSEECSFILMMNNISKFRAFDQEGAIEDRCRVIDFYIKDFTEYRRNVWRASSKILSLNEVEFDKEVLKAVIDEHAPHYRTTIDTLQRYRKRLTDKNLINLIAYNPSQEIIDFLKKKDYNTMRSWVENNGRTLHNVYGKLMSALEPIVSPKSLIMAMEVMNQFQWNQSKAVNLELHFSVMFNKLMGVLEFTA